MGSKIQRFEGVTNLRLWRGIAGTVLVAGILAGCDDQGQFAFPGAGNTGSNALAASGPVVERDIEAPEIFSVTDQGLWDGRPSLGGVWVAHPDVNEPERVIIRNQTNDKFVVGALFRRERNIPGPSLQISSDAAAALGILAGAPTQLNVTALTKVQEPSAAEPTPPPTDGELTAAPEIATASLDSVAPTAQAAPAPQPAPQPSPPVQATNLDKPFIQIGIFSVEANAERAAKQMRGARLAPTVKQSEINGKTFWRVLVGPAASNAERAKILSTIKSEGFTDAYAVSS
jgi:hypothetical protein